MVLGSVPELEQTIGSFAYPLLDPNQKLFVFILGALIYFTICFPLSLLARFLEGRFGRAYQTSGDEINMLSADMLGKIVIPISEKESDEQ